MSTYYCVICNQHNERTRACSHSVGGIGPLADSLYTLGPFIVVHHGCNLNVVSEHEDDYYSESFIDWTEANFKELMKKTRD